GAVLELRRVGEDYVIRAEGYDLMSSRLHRSEDRMMEVACPEPRSGACVLVGGLGMGYTLAATLDRLDARSTVAVVELLEAVIDWNRGPLADLAGRPLEDPRVEVVCGDVRDVIDAADGRFDAILLDV